ncbi:phosphocholine cytidylyltransferase family protein [Candidatus Saccharibacteria bacterium]|nr:phosphocholine cytidylyltransferase family protein [Candidatus Saccharibacteria bacterium]
MTLSLIEFEILRKVCKEETPVADISDSLQIQFAQRKINTATKALTHRSFISIHNSVISITDKGINALEPYRVKRAVILAAGLGSRMMPATENTPKPMVMVNGKRFIETQLNALLQAGITNITIVRGYKGNVFDQLLDNYPGLKFMDNPEFSSSNNIVSAYLARELLEDTYVIEGDLFISNLDIIQPYQYQSCYYGIPVDSTDDWYFSTVGDQITDVNLGSEKPCDLYVGISFWTKNDAQQLRSDLEITLQDPQNRGLFLEDVPLKSRKDNYTMLVNRVNRDDVIEVDTFEELQVLDQSYNHTQLEKILEESHLIDGMQKNLEAETDNLAI